MHVLIIVASEILDTSRDGGGLTKRHFFWAAQSYNRTSRKSSLTERCVAICWWIYMIFELNSWKRTLLFEFTVRISNISDNLSWNESKVQAILGGGLG